MNIGQFRQMLILIIISVLFFSLVWEFVFADFVFNSIYSLIENKANLEAWEFIVPVIVFVVLSLIYPYIVGMRAIRTRARQVDDVKRLSEEDHLTGLFNRRKINQIVEDEMIRCQRYGGGFAIIMCDLDFFKKVNDQYTHIIGDQVLQRVSASIKKKLRKSDSAGRWGGEEFLIFCPHTRAKGAGALAEKLRSTIAAEKFDIVGSLTCSFGVAVYDKEADLNVLLNNADNALYHAKNNGRNRVDVSSI